jgi:1,3-beta-glucanosyltransferase GAS1
MYQSLSCVVAPGVNEKNYGQLFGYVCGKDNSACDGIAANATTGDFGAYGMCNSTEQLGFIFNQYYSAQPSGAQASACDFGGAARTQAATTAGATCASLLKQAGTAGTGLMTSQPSGTGAAGAGGSGAAAAASSGAAGVTTVPHMESGLLPMAFIMALAVLSGMGMVLL